MNLTRRHFLKSTGAIGAYVGAAPMHAMLNQSLPALSALASPASVNRNKTLVIIFLRGGADGLNLVVPHGDAAYQSLRPSLAIPEPTRGRSDAAIDLDGMFGLHPRLGALKPFFDTGVAVAAHAVGYDKNTRSHFEEQDVWETGVIGNTVNSDGWVNRHLATSEGHGPIRALSVGDNLPRILRGDVPAYAIRGVEDLTMNAGGDKNAEAVVSALEHAYQVDPDEHRSDARDLLDQAAGITMDGMKELARVTAQPYTPAAQYPNTELARRLAQVARLIKADVGLEVAQVDFGGWDTHRQQGSGAGGTFGNLAGTLAEAVAAFTRDIEERMDDVVVVTLTDFGRTAAENGTQGTDHGWANCMFLLGGPVAKANAAAAAGGQERRVVSDWPGLAPDQLHQGRDLLHTTDFRDVLSELVNVHLGNPNLGKVLPDHECRSVGLIA